MVKDRLGRKIPRKKLIRQELEMKQNVSNTKYFLIGGAIGIAIMAFVIYLAY